jgi:hypothetical protein
MLSISDINKAEALLPQKDMYPHRNHRHQTNTQTGKKTKTDYQDVPMKIGDNVRNLGIHAGADAIQELDHSHLGTESPPHGSLHVANQMRTRKSQKEMERVETNIITRMRHWSRK